MRVASEIATASAFLALLLQCLSTFRQRNRYALFRRVSRVGEFPYIAFDRLSVGAFGEWHYLYFATASRSAASTAATSAPSMPSAWTSCSPQVIASSPSSAGLDSSSMSSPGIESPYPIGFFSPTFFRNAALSMPGMVAPLLRFLALAFEDQNGLVA